MEAKNTYKLVLIKKSHFTNTENKSCPNSWIAVNELQPNEDVLGCYQ